MSILSTNNWQCIFGFLDVDSCEMSCEYFPAASKAFEVGVFIVTSPSRWRTICCTCRESAEKEFEKIKNKGQEAKLHSSRFVLLKEWKPIV